MTGLSTVDQSGHLAQRTNGVQEIVVDIVTSTGLQELAKRENPPFLKALQNAKDRSPTLHDSSFRK